MPLDYVSLQAKTRTPARSRPRPRARTRGPSFQSRLSSLVLSAGCAAFACYVLVPVCVTLLADAGLMLHAGKRESFTAYVRSDAHHFFEQVYKRVPHKLFELTHAKPIFGREDEAYADLVKAAKENTLLTQAGHANLRAGIAGALGGLAGFGSVSLGYQSIKSAGRALSL